MMLLSLYPSPKTCTPRRQMVVLLTVSHCIKLMPSRLTPDMLHQQVFRHCEGKVNPSLVKLLSFSW